MARIATVAAMRAVLVATLGAAVALIATACGATKPTYPINVYIAGQHIGPVAPGGSAAFFKKTLRVSLGYAHCIVHVPDGPERVDSALALRHGRIDLPFKLVLCNIAIASQHQLFPHASEVTALSELLSVLGKDVSQVKLVPQLKRSGPVDPQPVAGSKLFRWGDPEQGFVGRPDRAGTRGGFGTYEPEIKRLAAKYGVQLIDLQGKSADAVRNAVLHGHPVIAWVGGPVARPFTWLTPSGKEITVDLGSHAIVLTGAGRNYVLLTDPVTGKTFKWSTSKFSDRWALIGQRALQLR